MKNERKPKPPIVAAHSEKKNGQKPAAPKARSNGRKTQDPHTLSSADLDISTLPLQNPYPVMRLGQDGQPLFGNSAAISLLGFSMDQSIPEDWHETVRATLEAGSSHERDIEHDGRIFSALFVPIPPAGYVNVYCRDITIQKQALAALATSEEQLRLATQAAKLCTWEMDILNQTYAVGDNFEDVVGFSKDHLPKTPGEVADKINVAEDMQSVRAVLAECVSKRSSEVPPLQYRLRHPETGEMIWVEVNARLVYNDEGQPQRMSGMLQNVTERKQLEELARAKEMELQQVIDQTPFMLTRCTRDLRYRFVSRAYAEMLGRKPEDVAGRPIVEIMGEEGMRSIAPYVERVLNGEQVEYESDISFKDVGTRSLRVIYTPDRDEQGSVVGWFASITDISTRKTAEQERNRALQREQWQREIAEHAWVVAEEARGKAEQELSERKLAEAALGSWANVPLPQEERPLWLRYGMALVVTAIVIVLRQLLDPLLGTSVQYSLLISAIAFSIWYSGVAPAFVSLLLGYVGITWLVLDWQILLDPTPLTVMSLVIFLISGGLVILLGETMRRAQRQAHQSAGLAVKRQRDIEFRLAEQQRAEQDLRASEQRFRDIFESAGVSVWVEDFSKVKALIEDLRSQGVTDFHAYFTENPELVRQAIGMVNVLDVNQGTLDLYHASSKEQLLGPLSAMFTPETERTFVDELAAFADGHEIYRSEKQTQTLDGQPISILFTIHFNPLSGDNTRVIVTITDITARRQMEQALRASEEKYRRIVETANEGIWEIDANTCTTFVNAPMAEMLGYTVEEMMGQSSFDFVFPEDNPSGASRLDDAKRGLPNRSSEFRFRRKDGSALWALISSSPQVDEHGNFQGSVAMMVDITERKQIEQELERERELFKRLFETMPVMSTIYHPETHSMRMNKHIQELTGWRQEDVTVESLLHALYPDPAYLQEVLGQMAAAVGTNRWVDARIQTRDGRTLDTLWANISIMDGEKIVTGISLGIDITERKRNEASLIEYARQQTSLFKLAEQLQHSYTPEAIYSATLDAIFGALHCDRASILLFDESDRMHFVAWRGLSDAYRQATDGHSPWTKEEINPQPIHFDDIDTAELSDELKAVIKQEGIGSLAFIPLVPNGQLIGKFMVYFNSPHAFSDAELDLSLTIARQLAFDIARKRAEEQLRRSAELDAYRVALADVLRPIREPSQIRSEALRLLGEQLSADRVLFVEVDEDAQVSTITDNYLRNGDAPLVGQAALRDYGKAGEILRTGRTLIVPDVAADPELGEQEKKLFLKLKIASFIAVPILKDGRWVANLGVTHGTARTWSEQEIALLEETVERTWSSLERARSQENLRASEGLYRAIARSIPGGGVYVVDKDMRYLVAEGPVTEAFGLSRQMLEGHTVKEVFRDERGIRMEDRLRRTFAGETVDFETTFNGRVYWTQQAPLYDSIGQAIILTIDITERKRAEDALGNSEERMRLAIESHRMVAWEWDVATDVVTTSANFQEVYGLSQVSNAAEGFALIWPEDLPAHQEKVNQVMQSGGEYHSEFRITRPVDGRVVWMEERATAIMDAQGKITRLVGIVIDVTERKEADENLRFSEQRLRMATEAAGMFAWDAEPATSALHWSENAADVIGCRPEELPAHMNSSLFFVAPEDADRVLQEYADVLEHKQSTFTTEFRGQGDAQTAKHFLMHSRILYDQKEMPIRVLGVTQDITRRKQSEQELREAREHAEQTADRIARLQEITSALAKSLTSEQLSELILEQGTRASGAAAGIMVEVIHDGKEVKTVAALGYPPNAVRTDPQPLADKTPISDAIRSKQAIWLRSQQEFAAYYPVLAELRRGFGNEATVALPLIVDDQAIGALAFSFAEPRDFLLEERGFLLALAQQCAQGLERVRAAEALIESEQRFAGFMQHLPGLAWIKDAQGRYVFANDAAEKAFRVSRADLYGHTDAEVFPPLVAEQFRRNDEQALLEGRGLQVVEELLHEDGTLHYSLVNKFPITGTEGAIALIGGMAIDITERKQAEERLALLAQISELTRDLEDADDLMAAVADAVGTHLQVRRCLFNEIDVENDVEVVHHDYHDGVESVAGVHRVTEYSSITSAEMMGGATVVNNDSKIDPRTSEDYERSYLPNGERSYVAVPLMRDGAWAASLWVSDDKPRVWSEEEIALLQTVAERTWTACEKLRINGALRDSEERLRVTFNTTAVGFAMLAPDTRFVDVNQAFCDIVGYTHQELLTMNFDYLIHPDYVKSTRDNIRRLLRGKVPATMIEKLYIRKDGSEVWVQNSMSMVRDVDGDPLHLIVISQDITERKQIEALQKRATESLLAAAEANAKFRTFFDQGSYFAGVMTLDGTLVEANRLSLEFCGYTRHDVIGKKFWDCGWWNPSPALMDMVRDGTQRALQGETFRQETAYYIADGSVRYVDLIIAPIKDETGRLLFLAPTGTDITERKRTEEELRQLNLLLEERVEKRTLQLETSDQLRRREMSERRQAQDRFAKSFNASPAAMSITRFEDGMYRNVNPKFVELLEYALDEIIGHTSLDLKIYKNPEERVELQRLIRSNNSRWNYETQLETKTGKLLDVSISVVEIELDGESHILSMIMDITERNQILAALRASEGQLRTLFDVLPVGVAYVSPDRRVIDPNRTLEKILGIPREALLTGIHQSLQYIRPDGSPMPESEFASARALKEQRTINNVETGIIKEGGQVIWTSVSATPISMPEPGVVVITVDVTERKHMDDELRRSHKRFQMLSRRLVEIQEEERRTISRELHDRVGQSLAALNLNLSFLNNSLSGTSSLQVKSRIKDAIQLTEETVSTIRDVMADLRPPALDDYGLEAALNAYADTFSRRAGVRVNLVKPAVALPRFNPSIELTVLRITQEALTNVAKHANATQAVVTLAMQEDFVYLTVEDNGDGIRSWQAANRPGSHGLKIMRERAETFGGTLQVQSFNKKGTRIEVKIPVRSNEQSTVRSETD